MTNQLLLATCGWSVVSRTNRLGTWLEANGRSGALPGPQDPGAGVEHSAEELLERLLDDALLTKLDSMSRSQPDNSWSAEISGFIARPPGDDRPPALPPVTTPVVLVSSDTDRGLATALICGMLLRRPLRVVMDATDTRERGLLEAGIPVSSDERLVDPDAAPAVVTAIDSLDPATPERYGEMIEQLGAVLRGVRDHLLAAERGGDLFVNMSGGFKSTIPLLAGLLHFLARGLDGHATVTAGATYERSASYVDLPVLPELITGVIIDTLRTLADNDGQYPLSMLGPQPLQGYAWERLGQHARLTPVGWVLADLVER